MSNLSIYEGQVIGGWRENSERTLILFRLVRDRGKSYAAAEHDAKQAENSKRKKGGKYGR